MCVILTVNVILYVTLLFTWQDDRFRARHLIPGWPKQTVSAKYHKKKKEKEIWKYSGDACVVHKCMYGGDLEIQSFAVVIDRS